MSVSCFKGEQYTIDDYDKAFSAYQINNIPLGNSPLINVSWIHNDEFILLERQNNVPIMQYGVCTDVDFIINIPSFDEQSIQAFLNHPEGVNQGFLVAPKQKVYWLFKENVKSMNFALKLDAVRRYLTESEIDHFVEKAYFNKRLDIKVDNLKQISFLGSQLINKSDKGDLTVEEANIELERIAMQTLLLPEIDTTFRRNNSSKTFTRALNFIRENYAKKIAIAEIANYANTSVRNLQYLFKAEINKTPLQFLNHVRIYHFHLSLEHTRAISVAARKCGLSHMGRVSVFYKGLFGMSPSQYLAQNSSTDLLSWHSDKELLSYIK